MLHRALKMIRVFHHLRQGELADRLEISKSYLCELELGKKSATLDLLQKYSDIFGIPISSLILFAENLEEDGSIKNRRRLKVANKILSIMEWLSDERNAA